MPDDRDDDLDRDELRAALLDLLRLAALWESGALRRGLAETREADERLLSDIVQAIEEHQSGERSVPVARVGKHVVRRVDLRLARVHAGRTPFAAPCIDGGSTPSCSPWRTTPTRTAPHAP